MQNYKHTQFGKAIAVLLVILVVYEIALMFFLRQAGNVDTQTYSGIITSTNIVFLTLLALFFRLTVEVDDQTLKIFFGIGLVRKTWRLSEIKSVQVVRNKWWDGWGIHFTTRGWIYNIDGLMSVEVEMKNGKKFRVGTDEPEKLTEEIKTRLTR